MPHENSEAIQLPNQKWANISRVGKTHYLDPVFPFEKHLYDTVDEATTAAKKRSKQYDPQGHVAGIRGLIEQHNDALNIKE